MLEVFLLILPFGLAAAVSPVMLTEQTVLLAGKGGSRAGRRFAAGAILVTLAWISLLVFFGRAISLPQEPKLDATLDLVIGALLVLVSLVLWLGRNRRKKEKAEPGHRFGTSAAFAFGAFSMATNFTSLALVVPGAKAIAAGEIDLPERALLVVLLSAMVATPAWLPVALTAIAPGPAQRGLNAIGDFIENHGRRLTVILLGALGLLLIVRGILRVVGI